MRWERKRLQKKLPLGDNTRKKEKKKGKDLVQSWQKLYEHKTEEGLVVKTYLYLHIVV